MLYNPNFIRSKGHKHAENHEEQTVAAEPGLLSDTISSQASAVWLCVNSEGIKDISRIPLNSMSECLILQSDSPPVCLSQSLIMERISINESECRTLWERSTLSSALIKTSTCLFSHRMLYYINTNYTLENQSTIMLYCVQWCWDKIAHLKIIK